MAQAKTEGGKRARRPLSFRRGSSRTPPGRAPSSGRLQERCQRFRSALEMIKLVDDALSENADFGRTATGPAMKIGCAAAAGKGAPRRREPWGYAYHRTRSL